MRSGSMSRPRYVLQVGHILCGRVGEPRFEEDFDRSPFVYFDARIVGGTFGTGLWPDHAERDAKARERSGRHEPVWVPVDELDGLDVRPKALVKLLVA